MGRTPFKDIYIHPTVLTKDGKRMSKSLGTGIDPVGLIEKYGADALRFGLAYQNTGIQDLKFSEDPILMGKKFANKFWNIARYILMKLGDNNIVDSESQQDLNSDILAKFNAITANVTKNI